MVWIQFALCMLIILFAGSRLSHYADAIAEKTGLGRIWIGLLLLGVVTSMPEMVTGVSSVALIGLPDLALGTVLGSCIFNLALLGPLDILHRGNPILSRASRIHILSAGLGILLLGITALSILGGESFSGWALGWIGLPSFIILVFYVLGARHVFRSEQQTHVVEIPTEPAYEHVSLRGVFFRFALTAGAVIGAGIWLSFIGDEIATTYNWSAGFVGSLFLAITTSMPELVVTITAVRMGAIDLAIADILGANMLDILAISLSDLFYTRGPILFQPRALVSEAHIITALVAIAMTLVVIVGLRFPRERKTFSIISWYGPLLIGLYIFGAYALYSSGMSG
ncbi:MAG: hypothetical protein V3S02_04510 [Dehalococcoidales bacterium]